MCSAKRRHVCFTPKSNRNSGHRCGAESASALPLQGSNVNLLRYCKSIIHIDAEIPDSTLYFGVAEQKLDRSQIPCAAVDQCRFGSPQTNAYRTNAGLARYRSTNLTRADHTDAVTCFARIFDL